MLKIGITGNIASGKSRVEELLREKGFEVLDADELSHDLLKDEQVKRQIITAFFGLDILENGEILRQKLAKIIFQNEGFRKKLEDIIHPHVKKGIWKFFSTAKEQGEKMAFASVPLLFEAKFEDIFDKIILVYADNEIRLQRLMKRNNLPLEYAQQRLEMQISQDKKISLADCVVYNNNTIEDLREKVEEVLRLL